MEVEEGWVARDGTAEALDDGLGALWLSTTGWHRREIGDDIVGSSGMDGRTEGFGSGRAIGSSRTDGLIDGFGNGGGH